MDKPEIFKKDDKIYTFFVKRFRSFFCSIDIERFRMKKDSKNLQTK